MATAFYETYRLLCEKAGKSDNAIAAEIGLSNSTVTTWKQGALPRRPTIKKVADYFGISVEEMMGYEQKETAPAPFTRRDERDIEKRLEAMLGDLDGPADGLMFSGEPLDDETRELLRDSLRNQLEMTKRLAKQKYTPKKYRKKEGE